MKSSLPNVEMLKFRIGLSGQYWDKRPAYSISINGLSCKQGMITAASGVTEFIEFELEVPEGDNNLEIRLENKEPSDTVQSEDKTSIVNDLLLNIDSIELDDIDLGSLKWSESKYVSDSDHPTLSGCINLGWNGTYTLAFSSPFYLWLLENM